MRKWPVARTRPSIAPGPISGTLSGVVGPQPGDRLDQLELGDLRQRPIALAQQLVDAAGRDLRVEALLLDRRADDEPTVAARDDVDALGHDDPLADRLATRARRG